MIYDLVSSKIGFCEDFLVLLPKNLDGQNED
nr:MAG TPA: hypothetical protein [Caudoviricetes sp.]